MTGAERQRLYRERRAAEKPTRRYKTVKVKDRRSLGRRWRAAVENLQQLQDAYRDWQENIPESLAETKTTELISEITDFDLDDLAALEPPRGFGRD